MADTLGKKIFTEIESNEYLQELFESILYNYSIKLFNIKKKSPISFNVEHALRFADLLSKSVDNDRVEYHKVWAQEIVALLYELYPEKENVKFYMGSILTNVSNYRGMEFHANVYHSVSLFEEAYEEYKKSILKIPANEEGYFFESQKKVYDSLTKERFSYSGPTSMGKSFVIRMFIKEQIKKGKKSNFAIVVPTKALINEVSSKIIIDLKELLAENNYRVITAAGALSLQQEHKFVLVLTPERLLYLMLDRPDFDLDYLFIDEAHKISSKDSRSPFYYKIVDLLSKRQHVPHFIFSSPNIPNPEVYLKLISDQRDCSNEKMTTSFTPVSQIKYLVDLVDGKVQLYNDYGRKFVEVGCLQAGVSLTQLIRVMGRKKKNIVYCNSTAQAVNTALEYAKTISEQTGNEELLALAKDIKNEIHSDYYLSELLVKGVAYHIGYLPSDIRMRIEDLFRMGAIKTIFCTSTLVEGVNLPADNLFITNYKNGRSNMNAVDFRNLIGRVGRIEFNLYGNVFLVRANEQVDTHKYIELIQNEVPEQKLSIVTELTSGQKKKIIESLIEGNIELLKYPANQSEDNYALMRKFAIILLKDIMSNNNSLVRKAFGELLTAEKEQIIINAFQNKNSDDDINISVDQTENLTMAIAKGLEYPQFNDLGNIDYNEMVAFLERLCRIYKWERYEATTLGYVSKKSGNHGKLRWYAVILNQWIKGNGLSLIMQDAIQYKRDNPSSGVEIKGKIVEYDDSIMHRNIVISDTLNAIEDVILFRIANYFLRFSAEYKRYHKIEVVPNDWYEYVEYGTTNSLTIFLQRNGFSREASTYIKKHQEYILEMNAEYKVRKSLLECSNKSVCKEALELSYNVPELFI